MNFNQLKSQLSQVITDQLQRGLLTGDLVRWAEKSERAALKIVLVWACTNVSDFRNNWGEFGRFSRSNANFAISECRVKFTWTLPSASKINKINFSSEAGAVLNFLLTFCFKTKSKSGCKGRKPLFLKKNVYLTDYQILLIRILLINRIIWTCESWIYKPYRTKRQVFNYLSINYLI